MASSDKSDRDKARAEARFRMEQGATAAAAEEVRRGAAEREKTARLRALRLARDEVASPAAEQQAPKKTAVKKPVRRGIGG